MMTFHTPSPAAESALRAAFAAYPEIAEALRLELDAIKARLVDATAETVPYLQGAAQWIKTFLETQDTQKRPAPAVGADIPQPAFSGPPDILA